MKIVFDGSPKEMRKLLEILEARVSLSFGRSSAASTREKRDSQTISHQNAETNLSPGMIKWLDENYGPNARKS